MTSNHPPHKCVDLNSTKFICQFLNSSWSKFFKFIFRGIIGKLFISQYAHQSTIHISDTLPHCHTMAWHALPHHSAHSSTRSLTNPSSFISTVNNKNSRLVIINKLNTQMGSSLRPHHQSNRAMV